MQNQNKTLLLLLQKFSFLGSWKFVNHIVKLDACYATMETKIPIYTNIPKIKALLREWIQISSLELIHRFKTNGK